MKILLTGGASGLGEAITKKLALFDERTVYFTYCKSKENASNIESQYKNTRALYCDFNDSVSVNDLIRQMASLDMDVLVNNATLGMIKNHFYKIPSQDFLKSFQENVLPVIQLTQEAIKQFRKKKFGKIITILSSAIVNKPPLGWAEYTANKAYLLSLSKSWAVENANFNITSNCISPSLMRTQLTSDIDERVVEMMTNGHPLKKLLTPAEVAEAVSFLVTCTNQINGTNLVINAAVDVI